MDDRVQRIQRILDCSEVVIQKTNPLRDRAWLSVDLTMPQLSGRDAFRKQVDGVWTANPFRLFFDLRQDPRRGREQAEQLRKEVIGF